MPDTTGAHVPTPPLPYGRALTRLQLARLNAVQTAQKPTASSRAIGAIPLRTAAPPSFTRPSQQTTLPPTLQRDTHPPTDAVSATGAQTEDPAWAGYDAVDNAIGVMIQHGTAAGLALFEQIAADENVGVLVQGDALMWTVLCHQNLRNYDEAIRAMEQFRDLYPNQVTDSVQRIIEDLYSAAAASVDTPPMEVIAASSAGESTRGTMTEQVLDLMESQRISFVEASRIVAETNRNQETNHPGRSLNVANPDITEGEPIRRALVFAAFHYSGSGMPNLPDIQEDAAPDSTFRQQLARDYGREVVRNIVRNPTGAQINDRLNRAILDLAAELEGTGRPGELMANFQGHGNTDEMLGTDGVPFTVAQLRHQANVARAHNIHLIVISDACLQSAAVQLAQGETTAYLQERLRAAGLPAEEMQTVNAELAAARSLMGFTGFMTSTLDEIGNMLFFGQTGELPRLVTELRTNIAQFDDEVTNGFAGVSSGLNGRIRAAVALLNGLNPNQTSSVSHMRSVFSGLVDAIGEEVLQIQQHVEMVLSISQ